MENTITILSHVWVYETDPHVMTELKTFLTDNNLVGVTGSRENMLDILRTNVELGAIFLSEIDNKDIQGSYDWILEIHEMQKELPIFIRTSSNLTLDDFPDYLQTAIAGIYRLDEIDSLKQLVNTYIFNTYFPNPFVRGILEISRDIIAAQFSELELLIDLPFIVKERIIYGELFSLMPLESSWCRGYMTLQMQEQKLLDLINLRKTRGNNTAPNFRDAHAMLGEVSNMIWGAIKARFIPNPTVADPLINSTQVPIIVNHRNKYITFGSEVPQLCYKYTLFDISEVIAPIIFYQKFVFNLNWNPDEFVERQQSVDNFVDSGELELF